MAEQHQEQHGHDEGEELTKSLLGQPAVPLGAPPHIKRERYSAVLASLQALLEGEEDGVAALASTSCVLHHSFQAYDWTGFYRACANDQELVIGPYQGGLGCLRIAVKRGVCGAAARLKQTQLEPDVSKCKHHIACASSTQSEVVVPVMDPVTGRVLAVLDVDSDHLNAFDQVDAEGLEAVCRFLAQRYGGKLAAS